MDQGRRLVVELRTLALHASGYKRTRSFYLNLDDARCVVGDPCPTGTCRVLPEGIETGPNVVHGTFAVGLGDEEGYAPASFTLSSEGVPDYVRFCFGSLLKHCRAHNGTRLLKEELGGRKWKLTAEKAVGCEPRHGYCWEFDFVIEWWPQ